MLPSDDGRLPGLLGKRFRRGVLRKKKDDARMRGCRGAGILLWRKHDVERTPLHGQRAKRQAALHIVWLAPLWMERRQVDPEFLRRLRSRTFSFF